MKVVVGRVSDFADGDRKIIDVNGKSIGVFRVGNAFYALRNRCPHQFGPLCLGKLAQRAVSDGPGEMHLDPGPPLLACPWHGWEYDIATGQSFMGPGRGNMAALTYDVDVLPGSDLPAGAEPGMAHPRPAQPGTAQDCAAPPGVTATDTTQARPDGRVPGPYVAETVPVSVEQEYVVINDTPARH